MKKKSKKVKAPAKAPDRGGSKSSGGTPPPVSFNDMHSLPRLTIENAYLCFIAPTDAMGAITPPYHL